MQYRQRSRSSERLRRQFPVRARSSRALAKSSSSETSVGVPSNCCVRIHDRSILVHEHEPEPGEFVATLALSGIQSRRLCRRSISKPPTARPAASEVRSPIESTIVACPFQVADHVVLGPLVMLAAGVRIGARVSIGAGAVVLPGRKVGDDAVIGAGAVVTTDVPAGACAKGVPARW